MKSSSTKSVCFNCLGTGVDVFYPQVEAMVACDAGEYFFKPDLESFIVDCPYCKPPPDDIPWMLLWETH